MRVLVAACSIVLAWLATPARGLACTILPDCRGLFVPAEGATIPANAPGFVWVPSDSQPASSVRFYAPADGFDAIVPLVVEPTRIGGVSARLLRLDATLVATREFVLLEEGGCAGAAGAVVHFRAGSSAPLPSTLGRAVVSEPIVGSLTVASTAVDCSADARVVSAEVMLELSSDAAPWGDLFVYRTEVDGVPWSPRAVLAQRFAPGTSWVGRGRDVVFAHCGSEVGGLDAGVAEGPHRVQMIAELPGTDIELSTEPVEVTLRCAPLPPLPPAPAPPPPIAPAPPPAPIDIPDASVPASDGGGRRRKFTSCAAADARRDAPTSIVIVLAALLVQRRRRRAGSGRAPSA